MIKLLTQRYLLVFSVVLVISGGAWARNNNNNGYNGGNGQATSSANDAQLVAAVQNKKQLNFAEGNGMVVTSVLPDDTQGLQHQKFVVKLSNGQSLLAVYNLDMCERVPVKVGDVVGLGGQFIWTNQGGLLHWLHRDPRGNRPDGYVLLNGKYYCK